MKFHLFALCSILCAWLIAGYVDTPVGRGLALGQFIVTVVLVRNEYTVAAVTFAAASLYREYRSLKRLSADLRAATLNRLWAYVVPVGLALALCLGAYSRSILKGKDLLPELHFKLTFNPCQLYAVGYQQRHPEWSKDPWHDCYDLQQAIFGTPLPTLGQMARANPRAVLGHFGWNLLLVPAGLQLALFNGTWGGPNPDFLPLEHPDDPMAVLLTFVVLGAVLVAAVSLIRELRQWWPWLYDRRGLWIAMLSTAAVSVPTVLTQRPRPSYLFPSTVCLMMAIGTGSVVLLGRRPRLAACGALAAWSAAIVFAPPYYVRHASAKPLETAYRVLMEWRGSIGTPKGRVVLGDFAQDLWSYTQLPGTRADVVDDYAVLRTEVAGQPLTELLDARHVYALFIQPQAQPLVASLSTGPELLAHPEAFGWTKSETKNASGTWTLLVRR
jgi:hypothetical protein